MRSRSRSRWFLVFALITLVSLLITSCAAPAAPAPAAAPTAAPAAPTAAPAAPTAAPAAAGKGSLAVILTGVPRVEAFGHADGGSLLALRPYARPLFLLYLIVVLRTLTSLAFATFVPVRARQSISASSTPSEWASTTFWPSTPSDSRYSVGVLPCLAW